MAGAGVGVIRPFQPSSEGAPGRRRWAARGFLFVGALVVSDLAEQVGQARPQLATATDDAFARWDRAHLICIDELGYMALDRRGAELLFQVLTEREEKNSVAIASNESFSGWTKTFTDPRLCAAIVDRLTFGAHIIETGTQSYRLAHTLAHRTS